MRHTFPLTKGICLLLVTVLLLSSLISCKDIPSGTSHKLETITEDLDLSAEMIACSVRGDALRIECISPGLDAYGLTVILYSLKEKKALCTVELGDDAWQTGWTRDGFYAISLTKKTAYLYDSAGNRLREIPLPQSIKHLNFAMMNESASKFLLGASDTGSMLLYDTDSGTQTRICQMHGYVEPMRYCDGNFYVSQDDDVLRISESPDYAQVAYSDPQIRFKSVHMGIGKTDTNFCLFWPDREGITYTPFQSVDEFPLDATPHAFLTVSSQAKSDLLRVYDLQSETIHTINVAGVVRDILFIDAYTLLVIAREGDSHHLYRLQLPKNGDMELTSSPNDSTTTTQTSTNTTQTSTNTTTVISSDGKHILSAPLLSQWPEFPTGCESVSTVMALRYAGETITVTNFIKNHLPKSADFYEQDGVRYGPDPNEYFIGSPLTSAAYGCMAPVIEKALYSYFGNSERVHNTTGTSLAGLCSTYIDQDIPVIVWATIAMLDTYPGSSWYLPDGTRFSWPANEHCLLLVGYDETHYYFNDPYTGTLASYKKALCENRYRALGSQSLVITR